MLHMPPVVPVGSLSTMVAFHASLLPVFCALRMNLPSCPGFIVAGPPLVITRPGAAMVSGGDETPRRPGRGEWEVSAMVGPNGQVAGLGDWGPGGVGGWGVVGNPGAVRTNLCPGGNGGEPAEGDSPP